MCGIAGALGVTDNQLIERMTIALAHRGPDDGGYYVNPAQQVTLGHRRLSIIDLSPAGHQPMSYADGRFWITFNGEIYNYQEIKADLQQLGRQISSASDTEVILAAYAQWGAAAVPRLRGMFTFAIWDEQEQSLFLARDRFGIKPLLYAQLDNVFLFASELKSLLASNLVSRQVDYQAIWDYLSFGAVPQPRTMLAQVKALLPGHTMLVQPGRVSTQRYWDIAEDTASLRSQLAQLPYPQAVQQLRQQLETATRYHLIADVPVGAFLSGGVDSTAVVGLMSQLVRQPIKTYSIGFETRHSHLSELKWAKIAAQRFGTDHTEVIITADEVAGTFDRLITAIDQPSLDGTNTYFVSQATRQGVTVSLSGLGGDELLAGYPHFRHFARGNALAPNGVNRFKAELLQLNQYLPGRWRSPTAMLLASPLERLSSLRLLMSDAEKQQAIAPGFQQKFAAQAVSARYQPYLRSNLDAVAQLSYVELGSYMVDTLLRDADTMSMAHALEIRPVLLDHVLAEFVFSLPAPYKLNGTTGKRIFIDALTDILPASIVHRPKMGFELPLFAWLSGPLAARAQTALATPLAQTLFQPEFLGWAKAALGAPQRAQTKLWAYIILLEWLQAQQCVL